MASAIPKRDISITWPVCRRPRCGAKHTPDVDCPPRGVWLVARFCPACHGASNRCAAHADKGPSRPTLTLVRGGKS